MNTELANCKQPPVTTYKEAGVDIAAGDTLVERIKPLAMRTRRSEVLAGVGGFAGLFSLSCKRYRSPVLVSGADGVGTKLKLAFELDRHDTIGIDLVAMNVNDILTCGAEPLFFLDYFATSKLDVARATQVVAGIASGCETSGCTLLGGETAEVPGFYAPGEYELAGFAVGVVERARLIDGKSVRPGDAVIGIASSGFHSNGYSLVRRALTKSRTPLHKIVDGVALDSALLEPTRIYVADILALQKKVEVKAMAHITGGGIAGNLPRVLPKGTAAEISLGSWQVPRIFEVIQRLGKIPSDEMLSTFNMGLGFVVVVSHAMATKALKFLQRRGLDAWEAGAIVRAPKSVEPQVVLRP